MQLVDSNILDYPILQKERATGVTDEALIIRNNFDSAVNLYINISLTARESFLQLQKLKSLTKKVLSYSNEFLMNDYAISKQVVENTVRVLRLIDKTHLDDLTEEDIIPGVNGTISIEWEKGEEYLIVDIGADYATFYAQYLNGSSDKCARLEFSKQDIVLLELALNKLK